MIECDCRTSLLLPLCATVLPSLTAILNQDIKDAWTDACSRNWSMWAQKKEIETYEEEVIRNNNLCTWNVSFSCKRPRSGGCRFSVTDQIFLTMTENLECCPSFWHIRLQRADPLLWASVKMTGHKKVERNLWIHAARTPQPWNTSRVAQHEEPCPKASPWEFHCWKRN